MIVLSRHKNFSSQRTKDIITISFSSRCCKGGTGMAAIPQSVLMAKSRRKKKQPEKDFGGNTSKHFQYSEMQNQPLCYSNKMMNSIWGQYNMYSVHNLKAMENDAAQQFDNKPLQQMLQGNHNQPTLELPNAEGALHNKFCVYSGQQLKNFWEPFMKNGMEFGAGLLSPGNTGRGAHA